MLLQGNYRYIALLLFCSKYLTVALLSQFRNTPLLAACTRKNVKIVESLVAFGAKIEATNMYGNTPFLLACKAENQSIIELLATKGANLCAKNNVSIRTIPFTVGINN